MRGHDPIAAKKAQDSPVLLFRAPSWAAFLTSVKG
ncbi:DUF397 domain-containing protein [Streptomyces sp. R28]|uniref:DUF397 domain-containing protein n=1 Tax=Streptomyces sp. R28 TaxID=3238628 RepID=A0AB39PX16_9ACTN